MVRFQKFNEFLEARTIIYIFEAIKYILSDFINKNLATYKHGFFPRAYRN